MDNHDIDSARLKLRSGAANVCNQRSSVELVQDLCDIRLHPRAESGRENQNIDRFVSVD